MATPHGKLLEICITATAIEYNGTSFLTVLFSKLVVRFHERAQTGRHGLYRGQYWGTWRKDESVDVGGLGRALARCSVSVRLNFWIMKFFNNYNKARSRRNWALTRSSAKIWRLRRSNWSYCAVASTRATSAFQRRMRSRGILPRATGWTWRIKWVILSWLVFLFKLCQLDLWQQNLEQVKENIKEVKELAAC